FSLCFSYILLNERPSLLLQPPRGDRLAHATGKKETHMLKEFKEFAMRGNVLDMAVGIIIGAAFGKIVASFVEDVMMPPLGRLMGRVDFSNLLLNLSGKSYATLAYGAQTPFSDQLTFEWEGGMWEYDTYHDSIITAGNGGTKATKAAFSIFYNQGTQRYDLEQNLQTGEQMWIDVGQLISQHVPDKNGNVLPAILTSGTYQIRDLANQGRGALFEGKVVFDKTYGHAAYGCGTCCAHKISSFALFYDPLGIPLDSVVGQGVQAYDTCLSEYDDVSVDFYANWSTADTSIATVNDDGDHTGMGVCSTTTQTFANEQVWERVNFCPIFYRPPNGGANATPNITRISPAQGLIGTTVYVTIAGSGFGASPTVSAGSGIAVSINYVSEDGTEIQAYFKILTTATPGNQAVTVTNGNQTSPSVSFFVQVPTSLSIVTGTDSTTSEASCGGNSGCGVTRSFTYQVYDQETPVPQPIVAGGLQVWDS